MRLNQIFLIAILLMSSTGRAVADIKGNCATIAVDVANSNFKDVNLWLLRYRATYERCLEKKAIAVEDSGSANGLSQTSPKEVSNGIIKSPNTKAVFQSPKAKSQPIARNISKTKKSMPSQKLESLAAPRKSKTKNASIPKKPVNLPVPASIRVQKTNQIKSTGIEGWRINCSARFGGWEKSSEWYISTAGKRVSCTTLP